MAPVIWSEHIAENNGKWSWTSGWNQHFQTNPNVYTPFWPWPSSWWSSCVSGSPQRTRVPVILTIHRVLIWWVWDCILCMHGVQLPSHFWCFSKTNTHLTINHGFYCGLIQQILFVQLQCFTCTKIEVNTILHQRNETVDISQWMSADVFPHEESRHRTGNSRPPLDVREHVRTNTKSNKRQLKALTRLFHGQQLHNGLKKTRWSPRTRMLTRMLMVQMSKHMVLQSRTIPFCNSLFEQSCACFPCYQSAVWSGKCRVWSVECEVRSVECKVSSGECRVCKV